MPAAAPPARGERAPRKRVPASRPRLGWRIAAALTTVAGLAFALAAPQPSDAQTDPAPSFQQVSAGYRHTCALAETGEIACSGWNLSGQTNVPAGRYQQVSAGWDYTCALSESSSVVCWGSGRTDVPPGRFQQVSAGSGRACALTEAGAVICWGANGYRSTDTPAGRYQQVSAGGAHSCALTESGTVSCWGDNDLGQADAPAGRYRQVEVGAGNSYTCALMESGTVSCWGDNDFGQADAPAGRYQQVSAGGAHMCALTEAGSVSCWGFNFFGQTDAPPGRYRQVSAGFYHTCAVSELGAVVCWGYDGYAQTDIPELRTVGEEPAADPPRLTIGERHADGYFPISFGGATLGQLKAAGIVLIIQGRPSLDERSFYLTDPHLVFQPGGSGTGQTGGLWQSAARLAALRDEISDPSDYDSDEHGGLAIPNLAIYVSYTQTVPIALGLKLTVTLIPAEGQPQVVSRRLSTAPPDAPAIGIAGAMRADTDQAADLGQIVELAVGLRVTPPFPGNEGAWTRISLCALADAPTGSCPWEVLLGANSRLKISGPATFLNEDGSKLLEGGLHLRCENDSPLFEGEGAACFILHDHDGHWGTPPRAPRIRIDGTAARNVAIDARIAAPAGDSFYAQLMNADGLRPLYHPETGSYYRLQSEYAGRYVVPINCTLVRETETVISTAAAGFGEAQVIERVRARRCAHIDGGTRTRIERVRYVRCDRVGLGPPFRLASAPPVIGLGCHGEENLLSRN